MDDLDYRCDLTDIRYFFLIVQHSCYVIELIVSCSDVPVSGLLEVGLEI